MAFVKRFYGQTNLGNENSVVPWNYNNAHSPIKTPLEVHWETILRPLFNQSFPNKLSHESH